MIEDREHTLSKGAETMAVVKTLKPSRPHPPISSHAYASFYTKKGRYSFLPLSHPAIPTHIRARVLRQRFRHFGKSEHEAAAQFWNVKASRAEALLSRGYQREYVRVFGSLPMFGAAYQISAIGREEYSEHFKRRARLLAQSVGTMRDIAAAHLHAARYLCRARN